MTRIKIPCEINRPIKKINIITYCILRLCIPKQENTKRISNRAIANQLTVDFRGRISDKLQLKLRVFVNEFTK